jgi:hypothetical protein
LPVIKLIIIVIIIKCSYVDKAIQEAHLMDSAISSSHNRLSTITGRVQKYTDMEEKLTFVWQLSAYYIVPLLLSITGIAPNKSYDSLKLLSLRLVVQKAVILDI